MFRKLGVQLYTIRDYMADGAAIDASLARLAELGYTEAHTAGCQIDSAEFAALLAKHGIRVVGTHYDYGKIINAREETIALHKLWGTTNIGIGGMPAPARSDLSELRSFIAAYNEAAKYYAEQGFKLTYHNHSFEFRRIDGYKTIMDILYEELDPENVTFVLDTCWVAAGGADVTAWMRKLKGRIELLHLKDVYLKRPTECKHLVADVCEIGYGNLDWDSIMATAEQIGVSSYIVEQDRCFTPDPFESRRMSAEFLAQYKK